MSHWARLVLAVLRENQREYSSQRHVVKLGQQTIIVGQYLDYWLTAFVWFPTDRLALACLLFLNGKS
jgi:hypothetical protein